MQNIQRMAPARIGTDARPFLCGPCPDIFAMVDPEWALAYRSTLAIAHVGGRMRDKPSYKQRTGSSFVTTLSKSTEWFCRRCFSLQPFYEDEIFYRMILRNNSVDYVLQNIL